MEASEAAAAVRTSTTGRARRTVSRISTATGPNVKIRGSAYQVFERYVALAREAQTGGDRIAAENLYQHAEHYFRIMNAQGEGQGNAPPRPMTPADMEMSSGDGDSTEIEDAQGQAQQPPPAPSPGEEPSTSY